MNEMIFVNMLRKLTAFSQRYPSLSLSASTAHRATHLVVIAGTEQDVVGGGVPLDQPYAPAVPMQLQERLHHVPLQPTLRDLPDPHLQRGWGASAGCAGLGGGSDGLFLRH